jgi:hypothetical protein
VAIVRLFAVAVCRLGSGDELQLAINPSGTVRDELQLVIRNAIVLSGICPSDKLQAVVGILSKSERSSSTTYSTNLRLSAGDLTIGCQSLSSVQANLPARKLEGRIELMRRFASCPVTILSPVEADGSCKA